jgi:hypothetical protein
MTYREDLVRVMGERMMLENGYSEDRTVYPIEWDTTRDDSQFSMMLESSEWAVAYLESLGFDFSSPPEQLS